MTDHLYLNIKNDVYQELLKVSDGREMVEGHYVLDRRFGTGSIRRVQFGDYLNLVKCDLSLAQDIILTSKNPQDSKFVLFNINFSGDRMDKKINGNAEKINSDGEFGLLFYPLGVEVSSRANEGDKNTIVLIQVSLAYLSSIFSEDTIRKLREPSSFFIKQLSEYQRSTVTNFTNASSRGLILSSILRFITEIVDFSENRRKELKETGVLNGDILKVQAIVKKYSSTGFSGKIKIIDLAQEANMSLSKFNLIFKSIYDTSAKRYLTRLKMDYALHQLKNTSKSVSEISFELSYSGISQFSRAFKNFYGFPPSGLKN